VREFASTLSRQFALAVTVSTQPIASSVWFDATDLNLRLIEQQSIHAYKPAATTALALSAQSSFAGDTLSYVWIGK
jgi:hypothetical protein